MKLSTNKLGNGPRHFAVIALLALMAFAACGQNLITNPGFESGATGYTTDYTVDTTPTGQGQAGVRGSGTSGTGSSSVFNSGSTSLTAHGGSKFFAVNGSTSGTAIVWEQTVSSLVISGLTGSTFTFSFWIAAGDAASTTPSGQRPTIAVIINGTSIGNVTPSTTDGAWTQFTGTWTRGTNTTADIKLIDLKTASTGNDFILDDFVLVPEPSTYAAGVFLVGAGYFAWRKARRKSAAQEIAVR